MGRKMAFFRNTGVGGGVVVDGFNNQVVERPPVRFAARRCSLSQRDDLLILRQS